MWRFRWRCPPGFWRGPPKPPEPPAAAGGGGIGYYLSLSINDFKRHQAETAIWAIVIVVWATDFLSAEVRKRLT